MTALNRARGGLLAVAWLVGSGAGAWTADEAAQERQAIDLERQAVAARFGSAQAACTDQFLLTRCLDRPRAERQQALATLQARQLVLDESLRRERAAQRLSLRRVGGDWASPAEVVEGPQTLGEISAPLATMGLPLEVTASPPQPEAGTVVPQPGSTRRLARPSVSGGRSLATLEAERHRTAFQARLAAAQAHREAVMARNQRQAEKRLPAPGLPVPPPRAASAAVPTLAISRSGLKP